MRKIKNETHRRRTYSQKSKNWKEELSKLRSIVLDCGLTEEVKWYQPCYSFNGSNLIILGSFKEFCTLSFFKGVLLKDEHKILEFAGRKYAIGENHKIY